MRVTFPVSDMNKKWTTAVFISSLWRATFSDRVEVLLLAFKISLFLRSILMNSLHSSSHLKFQKYLFSAEHRKRTPSVVCWKFSFVGASYENPRLKSEQRESIRAAAMADPSITQNEIVAHQQQNTTTTTIISINCTMFASRMIAPASKQVTRRAFTTSAPPKPWIPVSFSTSMMLCGSFLSCE